jgi:hypothetical protein
MYQAHDTWLGRSPYTVKDTLAVSPLKKLAESKRSADIESLRTSADATARTATIIATYNIIIN